MPQPIDYDRSPTPTRAPARMRLNEFVSTVVVLIAIGAAVIGLMLVLLVLYMASGKK